jgi:hypothetical protein
MNFKNLDHKMLITPSVLYNDFNNAYPNSVMENYLHNTVFIIFIMQYSFQ